MAGYGNRTAPDYTASSLADEHSSTRLGLTDSHSTPTYAAGYGNKHASQPNISPSSSTDADPSSGPSTSEEPTRFNTQSTQGSAPYSNAHTYGSASTAGAGWGNKTGSFSDAGDSGDSTLGKLMQKVGAAVHSPDLERRGQAKRDSVREDAEGLPPAN